MRLRVCLLAAALTWAAGCSAVVSEGLVIEQDGERSTYVIEDAQYARCGESTVVYLSGWQGSRSSDGHGIEMFLFVASGKESSGFLIELDQTEVPGAGVPVIGQVDLARDRGEHILDMTVKTVQRAPAQLSAHGLATVESQDVCKRLLAPFYAKRNPLIQQDRTRGGG